MQMNRRTKEKLKQESTLYRIKSGYFLREVAGEYLAIPVSIQDEKESKVVILNPVSKFLWEMLQTEQTMNDLIEAVVQNFDVSAEEAGPDIEEFIGQLKTHQLLQ